MNEAGHGGGKACGTGALDAAGCAGDAGTVRGI